MHDYGGAERAEFTLNAISYVYSSVVGSDRNSALQNNFKIKTKNITKVFLKHHDQNQTNHNTPKKPRGRHQKWGLTTALEQSYTESPCVVQCKAILRNSTILNAKLESR